MCGFLCPGRSGRDGRVWDGDEGKPEPEFDQYHRGVRGTGCQGLEYFRLGGSITEEREVRAFQGSRIFLLAGR